MTDDEDFTVIRRFNAAGHHEDESALDEVLAPGFVAHNEGDDVHGADGWRALLAWGRSEFGPSESGTDELIRGGPLIAERWWIRSTTTEGRHPLRVHGITMHRVVDGRIAEQWAVMHDDA